MKPVTLYLLVLIMMIVITLIFFKEPESEFISPYVVEAADSCVTISSRPFCMTSNTYPAWTTNDYGYQLIEHPDRVAISVLFDMAVAYTMYEMLKEPGPVIIQSELGVEVNLDKEVK